MSEEAPFRLFVVTGEVSGDLLATGFVEELRRRLHPRPLVVTGIGGARLEAAGLQSLFPQTDIQLMGVLAVLKRLPRLLVRISQTAQAVLSAKPDLLLTVDAQDFSKRVAKKVRAADPMIPIVHWVAPTVWAWRPGRASTMKPYTDHLLALLPFEPAVFQKLDGPPTTYVGHPLLDVAGRLRPDTDEQRQRGNPAAPVVLVLPGSRRSEIKHLLDPFREAVRLVAARYPHARFLIPAVPHLAAAIEAHVSGWPVKPEVLIGEAAKQAAFRRARAALAASGTVTLELALAGVPLVGAYRGNPVEAAIARRLVTAPSVLMCNLVLQRNVAPEFMQDEARPSMLADSLMALLDDTPERQAQLDAFAGLDTIMGLPDGRTSAQAAVDVALDVVASRST